eukprot:TRINITY_DN4801_c0_g1_i2.p1 TRINITY_DN4801_c0_g1~~TRINITY_DN4801_c0_g1_i2.p1  ORF type:complete len:504 (-),score=89.02 TRINITY_DN4801_c0_g1_i2:35-1546(-)
MNLSFLLGAVCVLTYACLQINAQCTIDALQQWQVTWNGYMTCDSSMYRQGYIFALCRCTVPYHNMLDGWTSLSTSCNATSANSTGNPLIINTYITAYNNYTNFPKINDDQIRQLCLGPGGIPADSCARSYTYFVYSDTVAGNCVNRYIVGSGSINCTDCYFQQYWSYNDAQNYIATAKVQCPLYTGRYGASLVTLAALTSAQTNYNSNRDFFCGLIRCNRDQYVGFTRASSQWSTCTGYRYNSTTLPGVNVCSASCNWTGVYSMLANYDQAYGCSANASNTNPISLSNYAPLRAAFDHTNDVINIICSPDQECARSVITVQNTADDMAGCLAQLPTGQCTRCQRTANSISSAISENAILCSGSDILSNNYYISVIAYTNLQRQTYSSYCSSTTTAASTAASGATTDGGASSSTSYSFASTSSALSSSTSSGNATPSSSTTASVSSATSASPSSSSSSSTSGSVSTSTTRPASTTGANLLTTTSPAVHVVVAPLLLAVMVLLAC